MNSIHPTEEQLSDFLSNEDDGVIVMINLLKFKNKIDPDGKTSVELYHRYMINVGPILESVGGRLLWMGAVDQVFIGAHDDKWDQVLLVEYPSRKSFMKMISNSDYQKFHKDREIALETSALLAGRTLMSGVS